MSNVLVYDTSAIAALIDAQGLALHYWQEADRGRLIVALPALAVAEVSRDRAMTVGDWEALLMPEFVQVIPLTETAAVEIGTYGSGDLAVCHALWEAIHLQAILVTRLPGLYVPGQVPLLIV